MRAFTKRLLNESVCILKKTEKSNIKKRDEPRRIAYGNERECRDCPNISEMICMIPISTGVPRREMTADFKNMISFWIPTSDMVLRSIPNIIPKMPIKIERKEYLMTAGFDILLNAKTKPIPNQDIPHRSKQAKNNAVSLLKTFSTTFTTLIFPVCILRNTPKSMIINVMQYKATVFNKGVMAILFVKLCHAVSVSWMKEYGLSNNHPIHDVNPLSYAKAFFFPNVSLLLNVSKTTPHNKDMIAV